MNTPIRLLATETWDLEQLDDLRARWWRGEDAWRIANEMWCNEQTVRRKVKTYRFQRSPEFKRRPPRRLSDHERSEAQGMFEAGTASWAIAERFGIDPHGVAQLARRLGWKRPEGFQEGLAAVDRWQPSPRQEAWLRQNWTASTTMPDMEGELRVTAPTIRRAAKRLGLGPRDQRLVQENRSTRRTGARRGKTIVKLHNAGLDPGAIGEVTNLKVRCITASLHRARVRGETVARHQIRVAVTPELIETVRHGYRLGLFVKTIARLLGAPETCTDRGIHHLSRRLGITHRNRAPVTFKLVAPEMLLAFERSGGDAVDWVQRIYRLSRRLTEKQAVRALKDYAEAMTRFPQIAGYGIPLRVVRQGETWREPSQAIEAMRVVTVARAA